MPSWPGAAHGRRTAHAGWVVAVNVLAHREKLWELFSPAGHLVRIVNPDYSFLEHLQMRDIRLADGALEAPRRASPAPPGPRIAPGPGHPVHRPVLLEQSRRGAGRHARMHAGYGAPCRISFRFSCWGAAVNRSPRACKEQPAGAGAHLTNAIYPAGEHLARRNARSVWLMPHASAPPMGGLVWRRAFRLWAGW